VTFDYQRQCSVEHSRCHQPRWWRGRCIDGRRWRPSRCQGGICGGFPLRNCLNLGAQRKDEMMKLETTGILRGKQKKKHRCQLTFGHGILPESNSIWRLTVMPSSTVAAFRRVPQKRAPTTMRQGGEMMRRWWRSLCGVFCWAVLGVRVQNYESMQHCVDGSRTKLGVIVNTNSAVSLQAMRIREATT
jgi:hypothetical protein